MTDEEFKERTAQIVTEALLSGLFVPYKGGWTLFYRDGVLHQFFKSETNDVVLKSEVTLNNFLDFCNKMTPKQVKVIFANMQLIKLQNRLINQSDE